MKICLEYVSANPNGPITVQHARAGVVGDILARLLTDAGHQVTREFYVNDAPGTTLAAFARAVAVQTGAFASEVAQLARGATLSDIVAAARTRQLTSLSALGVEFDHFTSEAELVASGAVDRLFTDLTSAGQTTWRGGALWLKSSTMGDDQDRVLVRTQGGPSYLANDIAYHREKLARGFDQLIDLWDAEHGAYIARTRAGLAALGFDAALLQISLIAPVRILKEGRELRVGRYGEFLALDEVLTQVSAAALRWQCALTPPETVLELDLTVANELPSHVHAALERTIAVGNDSTGDATLRTAAEALPAAVACAIGKRSPQPVAQAVLDLAEALSATDTASAEAQEAARAALRRGISLLGL